MIINNFKGTFLKCKKCNKILTGRRKWFGKKTGDLAHVILTIKQFNICKITSILPVIPLHHTIEWMKLDENNVLQELLCLLMQPVSVKFVENALNT